MVRFRKVREDAVCSWMLAAESQTAWQRFVASGIRIATTHATHALSRVAGQSVREVADGGSTEGGITESLAMMNGEFTRNLMTSSLVVKAAGSKKTQVEEVAFHARAYHGFHLQGYKSVSCRTR